MAVDGRSPHGAKRNAGRSTATPAPDVASLHPGYAAVFGIPEFVMADFLRCYTNLPALLYLLRERKITLLDPETWDDKNDSHFLSVYREKKSFKCVLALCFTQVSETYHH